MNLDQSRLKDLYLRKFVYRINEQAQSNIQSTTPQAFAFNTNTSVAVPTLFKNYINLPVSEIIALYNKVGGTGKSTTVTGRSAGGMGRGEYTVGALITGIVDVNELNEQGIVTGSAAYDILDPSDQTKYEVKELSKSKTGTSFKKEIFVDKRDFFNKIAGLYLDVFKKLEHVFSALDDKSLNVIADLLSDKEFIGYRINVKEYVSAILKAVNSGELRGGVSGYRALKGKYPIIGNCNIPTFLNNIAKFAQHFKDANFNSPKVKKLAKTFKDLYGLDKDINDEWFIDHAEDVDIGINAKLCKLGAGNCSDIDGVINRLLNLKFVNNSVDLSQADEHIKTSIDNILNTVFTDMGLKGIFLVKKSTNDSEGPSFVYILSNEITKYLKFTDLNKSGVTLVLK